MNYTLKKIALTEFAIGKWIYFNHLSENPPKESVPFNVFWECAPLYYQSSSILGKLQVWFYSIIIPFIAYKILEPAIFYMISYCKPTILLHSKVIATVICCGMMIGILVLIMGYYIKIISDNYKDKD